MQHAYSKEEWITNFASKTLTSRTTWENW